MGISYRGGTGQFRALRSGRQSGDGPGFLPQPNVAGVGVDSFIAHAVSKTKKRGLANYILLFFATGTFAVACLMIGSAVSKGMDKLGPIATGLSTETILSDEGVTNVTVDLDMFNGTAANFSGIRIMKNISIEGKYFV